MSLVAWYLVSAVVPVAAVALVGWWSRRKKRDEYRLSPGWNPDRYLKDELRRQRLDRGIRG